MKFPLNLTPAQAQQLEYEHISDELRAYLTRRLEDWANETDDLDLVLYRKNQLLK